MAKVYSMIAKRYIDVPDRVPAKQAASDPSVRAATLEIAGLLLEAEGQIKELTTQLEAEKTARKLAEKQAADESAECKKLEADIEQRDKDLADLKQELIIVRADAKTAAATAAAELAAEKRIAASLNKAAPSVNIQAIVDAVKGVLPHKTGPVMDIQVITNAVRAALPATPVAKNQYAVEVGERDANGRISKFVLKPK